MNITSLYSSDNNLICISKLNKMHTISENNNKSEKYLKRIYYYFYNLSVSRKKKIITTTLFFKKLPENAGYIAKIYLKYNKNFEIWCNKDGKMAIYTHTNNLPIIFNNNYYSFEDAVLIAFTQLNLN
jgi:hypothetical protein